jgi:hypothetical protein
MDEEIKAEFAEVNAQLGAILARMNDGFERVLDAIGVLRADFQNTKGFLPVRPREGLG